MSIEEFQQLAADYGLTVQERRKNFWAVSSDGYYTPIGNPVTLDMSYETWKHMLSSIASRNKELKKRRYPRSFYASGSDNIGEKETKMEGLARDTHFIGFTREVMQRMQAAHTDAHREIILARAAFDLACHTLYETAYGLDKFYIPERVIEQVPDLIDFPKDQV